jgi:hypothetical protein
MAARAIAPEAVQWGQGRLTWWGISAYDARLWATGSFEPQAFARHPFVLELTYLRPFRAADIARRCVDEMRGAGAFSAEQAARWQEALRSALPDVTAGDRIAGIHRPGRGLAFSVNDRPAVELEDPELARLFFSIWLAETTSDPGLRAALLRGPVR